MNEIFEMLIVDEFMYVWNINLDTRTKLDLHIF